MTKQFLFLTLVLGLVSVQNCSAKALPGEKYTSNEEYSDIEDGPDTNASESPYGTKSSSEYFPSSATDFSAPSFSNSGISMDDDDDDYEDQTPSLNHLFRTSNIPETGSGTPMSSSEPQDADESPSSHLNHPEDHRSGALGSPFTMSDPSPSALMEKFHSVFNNLKQGNSNPSTNGWNPTNPTHSAHSPSALDQEEDSVPLENDETFNPDHSMEFFDNHPYPSSDPTEEYDPLDMDASGPSSSSLDSLLFRSPNSSPQSLSSPKGWNSNDSRPFQDMNSSSPENNYESEIHSPHDSTHTPSFNFDELFGSEKFPNDDESQEYQNYDDLGSSEQPLPVTPQSSSFSPMAGSSAGFTKPSFGQKKIFNSEEFPNTLLFKGHANN